MKKVAECDADTMYLALDKIGVNVRELDKIEPTLEYLRELYGFLLRMQLLAWKAGKSHRGIVRTTNEALISGRPILSTAVKRGRQPS
jgi:hypothetical protein